jgi:dienelactone hydrolase
MTSGANSPMLLLGSATLSTTPSGSTTVALSAVAQTLTLLDGSARLDEKTIAAPCVSASSWDGNACRAFAVRSSARAPTPFVEGGQAVTLEVVIYRPLGAGPFPAVMFNHGSTGNGDDPSQFTVTYASEAIARFFAERGWLVAFPQRRGRGASDGLYDEGFTPDRSRYSCLRDPALAGFERALLDADAAADYLAGRSDVDSAHMLSAGTSRGGILAVVHAALRPDLFDGAVNFVGGWLGEDCQDALAVNRPTFVRGATFSGPTIWLYGDNDTFYSLAHSRGNFDAFVAAGGTGRFDVFSRAPALNGHFLVNDLSLWSDALDEFVRPLSP